MTSVEGLKHVIIEDNVHAFSSITVRAVQGAGLVNPVSAAMLRAMTETRGSQPEPVGDHELDAVRVRLEIEKAEVRVAKAELRAEKAEAQLAAVRSEELQRQKYRQFQLGQRALDGGRWTVMILASWVPIQALQPIAQDFAGKSTEFRGSIEISILFSVTVAVAWGITAAQSRLRKRKIEMQRARLTRLEKELGELKGQYSTAEVGSGDGG